MYVVAKYVENGRCSVKSLAVERKITIKVLRYYIPTLCNKCGKYISPFVFFTISITMFIQGVSLIIVHMVNGKSLI